MAGREPDPQAATIAFLAAPETHGGASVRTVRTHASLVFLAGERAFKLKRAVKFPYLDFSTVGRRRAACAAELALNRRTAPQLYLAVQAVVRRGGGLALADAGDAAGAVDWVVVMRRFPDDALLDAQAARGPLPAALIEPLARDLARFLAAAEIDRDAGGAAGLERVIAINDSSLRRAGGLDPVRIAAVAARSRAALARHGALLDARRAQGLVRRGHGDLHLANVCVVDGAAVPFDCIEFNEDLARGDVLYDLAFLLMDLWHRGQHAAANLLLNRYLDETDDEAGLAAMPLFLSLRAAIRAHVHAAAANAAGAPQARREEAARYLDLALALLEPPAAALVAIGGLSGSGKSTLATAFAPRLGPAPGARIASSDRIRKRLFGAEPTAALPPSAYAPGTSARVYARQRAIVARTLAAGHAAIADAVFAREAERAAVARVAAAGGVAFAGVWLQVPQAVQEARVAARRGDPSDATPAIVRQQAGYDLGRMDWAAIDAGGPVAASAAKVAALVSPRALNAPSAPAPSSAGGSRA